MLHYVHNIIHAVVFVIVKFFFTGLYWIAAPAGNVYHLLKYVCEVYYSG